MTTLLLIIMLALESLAIGALLVATISLCVHDTSESPNEWVRLVEATTKANRYGQ